MIPYILGFTLGIYLMIQDNKEQNLKNKTN